MHSTRPIFYIRHRESKQLLRIRVKNYPLELIDLEDPVDFSKQFIRSTVSDKGHPGFWFPCYGGISLWWLDPKHWRVLWNEIPSDVESDPAVAEAHKIVEEENPDAKGISDS